MNTITLRLFREGDEYAVSEVIRRALVISNSKDYPAAFIEENGYEIAGAIRESYIDGVWNKDSEAQWLSEIQVPIRKKDGCSS